MSLVTDCTTRANVIHVAPTRSMLADGLAQYLVWKQWKRWLLVVDSHDRDKLDRSRVQQHGAVVAQRVGGFEQFIRGGSEMMKPLLLASVTAALVTSSPSLSRISSSEKC
jgi:hypothetical protein